MRHYELSIRPFRKTVCDKEQALKPLEEAAEIYGAWQELIIHNGATHDADARMAMLRDYVIDECVDTIQAAVNMLAALTVEQGEIDMAIGRMDARNDLRGRF
jgi:hypothetical protein